MCGSNITINSKLYTMKIILNPSKERWYDLSKRPRMDKSELEETVREIIYSIQAGKDNAVRSLSAKYDNVIHRDFKVSEKEITEAKNLISEELKEAIDLAKANIWKFHSGRIPEEHVIETTAGVKCWRKSVPIERVGLYIPGGSAPLFSTLLMLGIPAKIAGCREIILCTPPDKDGNVNPLILYTAGLIGITDIYTIGGAQAIAAMAYGTETIPRVYKIFGPGNQYVTKAKEMIQQDGIAIDLPAGPSEVLVIADKTANPEFIAADLLSQAEHGPDSQVVLLTDDPDLISTVKAETDKQLQVLPRKEIAEKALEKSKLILLSSIDECIEFSNSYAPEHLIINTSDPDYVAERVTNAGSVFLGTFSCESAGDYASGPNHTLPTNGFAKSYTGVSTESFIKRISFQEISREGLLNLGPAIELMAEAESLQAHKNAVTLRLKSIKND
jgi:histidinol dehydrogenase